MYIILKGRQLTNRNNKRAEYRAGFTIVELLIVVVVIAILAAIVIISYNGLQSQARATAFVSAIDAFEKEARLYKGANGHFYDATQGTGYQSETTTPQAGSTIQTMHVCIPGVYPAQGVFKENECFVQSATYTYVGDSIPAKSGKVIYDVPANLAQQMAAGQISSQLPAVPLDNGYQWSYSVEIDVTKEDAESVGLVNPRAGRVKVEAVEAFRGIFLAGCDMNDTSCVYIIYNLAGDQACGRGSKTVQNTGALLEEMAGQTPGLVYSSSSQKITKCTLVLR